MCTIVEEFAKEYAIEYAKEEVAKAEAKATEKATGEAVDRLIAALGMSPEQACEIIGISMKDYNAYKKQKA